MTKPLTIEDYRWASEALGCELATMRAVAEVEAAGSGFLKNGFPRILFESRWFDTFTGGRFRATHPDLSTPKWTKNYKGGEAEYQRLGRAMLLARSEALKSTSWGMFQVMGFHFLALSYDSIEGFVKSMMASERDHLDAAVKYILHHRLHRALRARDWPAFARGYNGPCYAENQYDEKLAAAYERYAGDDEITQVAARADDRQAMTSHIQAQLRMLGHDLAIDGICGPATRLAIKNFQISQRLNPDGIPGPMTRAALDRAAG